MRRIESLDYLRGLMALSVMLYHFSELAGHLSTAGDLLGRLGIYAVSIFYVLSGLSLTVVYKDRLGSGPLVAEYALKRAFRIVPLFWLVVTLALVLGYVMAGAAGRPWSLDWYRVFLNYSLLFGFVKPDAYFSMGAWSIGNETVFYVLFPLLVSLGTRRRLALAAAGVFFLLAYVFFAMVILDAGKPLASQFKTYINPLNQAFLFVAGIMIGFYLKPRGGHNLRYGLPLLFALVFWLYPAAGDLSAIVTGTTRIALTFICIALVAAVYVYAAGLRVRGRAGRALQALGEISYGVYLLHPLIGLALRALASSGALPETALRAVLLLAGIPLTLLASYASYRFLEKPLMNAGGRLAARIGARAPDASKAVAG